MYTIKICWHNLFKICKKQIKIENKYSIKKLIWHINSLIQNVTTCVHSHQFSLQKTCQLFIVKSYPLWLFPFCDINTSALFLSTWLLKLRFTNEKEKVILNLLHRNSYYFLDGFCMTWYWEFCICDNTFKHFL